MADAETSAVRSGTLDRGLAILELVAARGEVTAVQIQNELGISRSASYRLVERLVDARYLEPVDDRYQLGMAAVRVGMAAVRSFDIVRMAPQILDPLARETGETSFLAVYDNNAMVYVGKAEGSQSIRLMSRLGARGSMHCTSLGKAFLAALEPEERATVIEGIDLSKATENSIAEVDALEDDLERTEDRGFAIDVEENEEGVVCVGAAICDHLGHPVAAISVSGPRDRVYPKRQRWGELVAAAAKEASARLGYIGDSSG